MKRHCEQTIDGKVSHRQSCSTYYYKVQFGTEQRRIQEGFGVVRDVRFYTTCSGDYFLVDLLEFVQWKVAPTGNGRPIHPLPGGAKGIHYFDSTKRSMNYFWRFVHV